RDDARDHRNASGARARAAWAELGCTGRARAARAVRRGALGVRGDARAVALHADRAGGLRARSEGGARRMSAHGAIAGLVGGAGEDLDPYAERILDAAREELAAYGLRRTTLDDIAARAGVGRATLYRRFAGRDTLLAALVAREARRLIAYVDAQMRTHDSP